MTEPSLKKNGITATESMNPSASSSGKKNWQSPELTEVDYDKTNMNFSGSTGFDGMYYS